MFFLTLVQGMLPRIKDIPSVFPPIPVFMALPRNWSFSEVSQEVLA